MIRIDRNLHGWHLHVSFYRSHDVSLNPRGYMRLLRAMGSDHGSIKHARDLMRRAEKREARR